MNGYSVLGKNRYFEVLGALNAENRSDHKVGMLVEVDMSSACRLRRKLELLEGLKPSYTALVAKAVALALRLQPHVNRIPLEWPFWKRIVQLETVHVSIAVERDQPGLEQAVFVGTLRNTDACGLDEITRKLQALAQATPESNRRWRVFKWIVEKVPCRLARWILSVPRFFPRLWIEHRGGAALISSPAKYGVDVMLGTWPWPLGFSFGLVKERPVVAAGQVTARPTLMLTLSFDRRLMGGAPAARFLRQVADLLEQAERELAPHLEGRAEVSPLAREAPDGAVPQGPARRPKLRESAAVGAGL